MEPEDSDQEDYLQNPELWGARLPQPYRMIEKILNKLFEETWDLIEQRQVLTQQALAKVKVPGGPPGAVLCADVLSKANGGVCSNKDLVFIGNDNTLCVLGVADGEEVGLKCQYELQYEVIGLTVVQRKEVYLIVVQHSTEIRIVGYVRHNFLDITDIPSQSKEPEEPLDIIVSPNCSHVIVSWSNSQHTEIKLCVYQVPVESWLPLPTPADSQVSITSQKDGTYAKPVLLYTISPPSALTHPTTSHPYAIFQSVCDQAGEIVPDGELHSLTKLYFENRRKAYTSKRQPFVDMACRISFTSIGEKNVRPNCHFITYNSRQKRMAVWWEGQASLMLYPLEETSSKSSIVRPSQRVPQATPILHSCVSEDTNMLAMGLQSGTVVIWDMRLGLCNRVVSCVLAPDEIARLKFFPSANGLMLAMGTNKGKLLAVDTDVNSNSPAMPLNSRVKNQQEVYGAMFERSGYNIKSKVEAIVTNPHLPSLLLSIHANGAVVVWDVAEHEALCKSSLHKSYQLLSPTTSHTCGYAMTENGHHLLLIGKLMNVDAENETYNVVSFDFHSEAALTPYWKTSDDVQEKAEPPHESDNHALLNLTEKHLRDYVQSSLSKMDENLTKWHEHWKELPNKLVEQYD